MTARRPAWLLAAVLVAACSSTAPPAPSGAANAAPTRDDAARTRVLGDSIVEVYGSAPQPAWYKYLRLVAGRPVVNVSVLSAFVGAAPTIPSPVAEAMCRDIATVHFDENAVDLGFTHVRIETAPGVYAAECTIPGR